MSKLGNIALMCCVRERVYGYFLSGLLYTSIVKIISSFSLLCVFYIIQECYSIHLGGFHFSSYSLTFNQMVITPSGTEAK